LSCPIPVVRECPVWQSGTLADGDGDSVQPRPTPIAENFGRDDVPSMLQGAAFSRRQLFNEMMALDLRAAQGICTVRRLPLLRGDEPARSISAGLVVRVLPRL
jgi:hypothetical protein